VREEVQQIKRLLEEQVYVTDAAVATALYLSMTLGKPLLVEGPAGVGKTEIAKVLAKALNTKLIRLQCYEGLDATTALYEWNYPRQLLHIKLEEASPIPEAEKEATIFSEAFLLKRPLLQAITEHERAPVLLIDEIDRSDEEFEAFLLEVLSDFQVTIPEIGTITATHRPHVILTSNRSRDLSDALRRRCLYHWIDYPSLEKELAIVHARENIRINALCPGPLKTELLMNFLNTDEKKQRRLVHIPMGRFGEAEEIARAALFLVSDDASYVTGTEFLVDGGITAAYVTPA